MRLSAKAMALAVALLWGVYGMLGTGLMNMIWPPYGGQFLALMSSVYPGFHASRTIADVLTGACYGALDGAVAGFLFAWMYNLFVEPPAKAN